MCSGAFSRSASNTHAINSLVCVCAQDRIAAHKLRAMRFSLALLLLLLPRDERANTMPTYTRTRTHTHTHANAHAYINVRICEFMRDDDFARDPTSFYHRTSCTGFFGRAHTVNTIEITPPAKNKHHIRTSLQTHTHMRFFPSIVCIFMCSVLSAARTGKQAHVNMQINCIII